MSAVCDRCTADAVWAVFAAHDSGSGLEPHPLVARYPAPMIRACADHLHAALADDIDLPASTLQWVIRPLSAT